MEVQADRRDMPPDPKTLQRITLGQLVERYSDTVSVRKRTSRNEQILLNAFLRHPLCRRAISDITKADFAAYRDERLKEIKPSSLRRSLVPLRNLYELAKSEWGLPIKDNPLSDLKIDGVDRRRERRLRADELERLINSALSCRNKLIAPIIQFALATAMRRGEILAARWDDVDLHARTLLIRQSKNGQSRTIPLSHEAVTILGGLDHCHDRVFPLTGNAIRLSWQRVTRRAGVVDLHFHDLRHEAISRLFEKNLSPPEAALISGHKDMRMLFRYSHAMRQTVLEKLDAPRVGRPAAVDRGDESGQGP